MRQLQSIFREKKPIIGMVHLRPLPGSPMYDPASMDMTKILEIAVDEAKKLQDAGVDGVQVENMWDIPYNRPEDIGYETAAALAVGIYEVGKHVSIPVGAECHMNGAECAMASAVAAGARWIRVFEWCNAFISQSGFVNGAGGRVSRMRDRLKAGHILALCDVNVKHGSHYIIHDRSVKEQAMDIEAQGGDAVIVTGFDTGMPPTVDKVLECKAEIGIPVLLGSGLAEENITELLSAADGAIVGSTFKVQGKWQNPVDYYRTKAFMDRVVKLRDTL